MSTPRIDAWLQHPTLRMAQQEMFSSLWRWTKQSVPTVAPPIEFTIAAMDEAGIERGMICAWYGPNGPLISNDEVAECVARYPDRLVGVASGDIRRPMDAVREIRRCAEEFGFKAVRMLPWLWNLPPNDRRYYPIYAACIDLGLPFCLQVGHTGPLCPSEPGRPIPYLDDVALEFPELTLVGGHVGFPWHVEMIALAMKYENVYIDTSAWVSHRYPAELVAYMKGSGNEKVLFGSNFPMLAPSRCLKRLDELDLSAEQRDAFLGGNAKRVFGLS